MKIEKAMCHVISYIYSLGLYIFKVIIYTLYIIHYKKKKEMGNSQARFRRNQQRKYGGICHMGYDINLIKDKALKKKLMG
jgi:hypothetical protein